MIKDVAINIRPNDRKSIPFVKRLIDFLQNIGTKIILPDYEIFHNEDLSNFVTCSNNFINLPDMVIVIGGDGTLLATARSFSTTKTPLLGINRGRLGFLTEFSPDEAFCNLDEIIKGNFKTTKRAMLDAIQMRKNTELSRFAFLNDAVISKGKKFRPITLQLELDNEFLDSYSGDGLIISTATGSTAYSLSAGGPIITPTIDNIFIINPICPHSLAVRPMIISTQNVLRIKISTHTHIDNVILTVDGQEAIQIEKDDEILIKGTNKRVYLITHPKLNFYQILRQKLGWGKVQNEKVL